MYRNTYVEIDVSKIKNNVKTILKTYNYQYYIGVVKGNGYGHGAYIAKSIVEAGLNYLAVSTLDEVLEIRKYVAKNIPILCLQPIEIKNLDLCLKNNVVITISSYNYFQELIKVETIKGLKVHLKLDTGMNRLGINNKEEVDLIYNYFQKNNEIKLEGIYTHLATTGISDNRWDKQIQKFKFLISKLDLSKIPIIHVGGTNTLVYHPKLDFCNGIRIGIILYGVSPRPLNKKGFLNHLRTIKRNTKRRFYNLSPIKDDFNLNLDSGLSLISEIIETKDVKKGEYVGYGINTLIEKDIKIAVIPIGYADGLSLKNSGRNVIINNRYYPIIGIVNMGMIIVQIDESILINDKVIIIGDNIRYICAHIKTTPYQLFSSISKDLPRIYIENGKRIEE